MRTPPPAALVGLSLSALLGCQEAPPPADAGDMRPYAAAYTLTPFDKARITSRGGAPNFHRLQAPIDLHDGPFASVKLVIDLATTCFPFDGWKDNPPPMGQSWPADCDAFDRNFEFSLDDPETPGGTPAIELVRAITPFGGPLHLEQDLTDVANGLPGRHRLQVLIPTYSDGAGKVTGSDGGWNVTARIEATPGPAPRRVLAVVPVWNLSHGDTTEYQDTPLTVPAGTRRARLEYRVTGHGGGAKENGCIGPAEEFCKRTHGVSLDGQLLGGEMITPWRTDCAKGCTLAHFDNGGAGFDYCQENPCGAIQSVKASRANWCPGSLTPPFVFEDEGLAAPGAHALRYAISRVAPGGSIRLSATYFAFGE